jgi:hypothetical protein
LAFACFALAPASRALSPAPDGGYASGNTAEGTSALFSLTTGAWNTGLGFSTTFVAGISGSAITGTAVVVNANGRLGVATSSERFKAEIRPMDKASEVLLALKPVTFRYKEEIDPEGIPQFGLVAEEVKKVNPALVTRDAQGKVFTVRYDAVNAMLLNEFLKEHRKVEEQEATIARQQKQIEALTTGLQKVSDQLELSKPAAQVVQNNQ